MATKLFVVYTNPQTDEADSEYNDWYTNKHLHDIIANPGFVAATRYRIAQESAEGARHRYMAIYEVTDGFEVKDVLANMGAAPRDARMSEVMQLDGDGGPATAFWEQIGERTTSS